jgi:hypothetical protein
MYTNASENGTPDYYRTTHHHLFVQLYGWHHWPSLSRRRLVVGHKTDTDQLRCHMPDAGAVGFFIWVDLRGRKIVMIGPFIFALFCGSVGFNLAAFRLGQHADPEKIQLCNEFCQHQLRRGEAVAIVLKRHGLSAACDDRNTDVIISLVTPFYHAEPQNQFITLHKIWMTIICYIEIKKVYTMSLVIPDQAS